MTPTESLLVRSKRCFQSPEDLLDFHADQAPEARQIEVHARKLLLERSASLSLGLRKLGRRRDKRRCARNPWQCRRLLGRWRRDLGKLAGFKQRSPSFSLGDLGLVLLLEPLDQTLGVPGQQAAFLGGKYFSSSTAVPWRRLPGRGRSEKACKAIGAKHLRLPISSNQVNPTKDGMTTAFSRASNPFVMRHLDNREKDWCGHDLRESMFELTGPLRCVAKGPE